MKRGATAVEAVVKACGTYAGYQRHKREGTQPCPSCKRANTEYMRNLRAARRERGDFREADWTAAANRALWRLKALHPGQFQILLDEELGR